MVSSVARSRRSAPSAAVSWPSSVSARSSAACRVQLVVCLKKGAAFQALSRSTLRAFRGRSPVVELASRPHLQLLAVLPVALILSRWRLFYLGI